MRWYLPKFEHSTWHIVLNIFLRVLQQGWENSFVESRLTVHWLGRKQYWRFSFQSENILVFRSSFVVYTILDIEWLTRKALNYCFLSRVCLREFHSSICPPHFLVLVKSGPELAPWRCWLRIITQEELEDSQWSPHFDLEHSKNIIVFSKLPITLKPEWGDTLANLPS